MLKEMTQTAVAVLFVHAAPDLAFDLYRNRRKDDEPADADTFMRMLSAPVERDVPFMISEADAVIYIWSGERNYSRTLSALAEELGHHRHPKRT
jgi:hypothetical protein